MQSSRTRRKKKFSRDLKHSHHRVRTTSSQSINTTRSNDFWQENSAAARCETTRFSFSEPKLKKRRLYVRDVYNKCTTHRKKNIGKANKKTTKKFLHLCIKKTSNFQHNYFINNTHKDNNNNNNNNNNNESDDLKIE